MLATQVLLDRAGFSPGEIDGKGGANTQRAIDAYERETHTRVGDAVAAARTRRPSLHDHRRRRRDAARGGDPGRHDGARRSLTRLHYTSHLEMLGERFHASPALLRRLNPQLRLAAGEQIVVPNVHVVSAAESKPAPGIVVRVSKGESILTVRDSAGKVVMHAPVTSGSEHDPLPIGDWTVTGVSR